MDTSILLLILTILIALGFGYLWYRDNNQKSPDKKVPLLTPEAVLLDIQNGFLASITDTQTYEDTVTYTLTNGLRIPYKISLLQIINPHNPTQPTILIHGSLKPKEKELLKENHELKEQITQLQSIKDAEYIQAVNDIKDTISSKNRTLEQQK